MGWLTMAAAQNWPPKSWTQAVDPFHIVGPVYYVGSAELAAYLLVDESGLVLVNVGLPENVPMVFASIRQLGHDPADIQAILLTQAHFDHAGGAEEIARLNGIHVLAGAKDQRLLMAGGLNDPVFGDRVPFPGLAPTSLMPIQGGDWLEFGDLRIHAIATPGHTPGSTSWLLGLPGGERVLIQASVSLIYPERLHANAIYPHAFADFAQTTATLNEVNADYYLPDHMQFAKPSGAMDADINPDWFKDRDVLNRQLLKTQRLLLAHRR